LFLVLNNILSAYDKQKIPVNGIFCFSRRILLLSYLFFFLLAFFLGAFFTFFFAFFFAIKDLCVLSPIQATSMGRKINYFAQNLINIFYELNFRQNYFFIFDFSTALIVTRLIIPSFKK